MNELQVFPSAIEFENVQLKVRYVMSLTVQNISTSSQRYRIIPPRCENFKVGNSPIRLLAPGLEVTFDISFEAIDLENDVKDRILIECGHTSIEVPLLGRVAASKLEFDGFVNLGPVVLSNKVAKYVIMKNNGKRDGVYTIEYDEALSFSVSPTTGSIPPSEEQRIKIEYTGGELGVFRSIANVRIRGQSDRVLDISATVVEHRLEFVFPNGGGTCKLVPFGSLYYGQQRTITALLINNGPKPAAFQCALENEQEDLNTLNDISITPSEGVASPYSEMIFTFVYKPIKAKVPKGFSREGLAMNPVQLKASLCIESSELDQSILVPVTGTAVYPNIEVSQRTFDFGECSSGERVDIILTIKNSGSLPVQYAINKVAHFSCRPSKGRLEALQSQTTLMSFTPSQLGHFQNVLHLVVGKGLQTVTLSLKGESQHVGSKPPLPGGLSAIPIDFHPKFNFLPKEAIEASKKTKNNFRRVPAWKRAIQDGTATFDPEVFAAGNDTHLTFSVSDIQKKQIHKTEYTKYLKDSRTRRLETTINKQLKEKVAKGSKTLDPNHPTNIGLEPQSGMEGPMPFLPKATEPLWLKDRGGRKMRGNQGFDEDKLIRKKYKAQPVTQAERKDCCAQLSSDELKCVIAGPKHILFEDVCVQSLNKKNFAVTNDLKQNIHVQLFISPELMELQETMPLSQVIPANSTAGFDITFFSHEEKSFEKSLTYCINGLYTYKVSVKADVVPISIELSRETLNFDFVDSNTDHTTSESLTLSNPGNAEAKFRCRFVSGCPFTFDTESGTIPPRQAITLLVNYSPKHGMHNEAVFEIQIDGGKTYNGTCIGHSPEPKCAIKEKKLDFGTIAAGLTKSLTCTLSNTGTCSAVFYVENIPESYGISISPSVGKINQGTNQVLTLSLDIRKPLTFNDVVLRVSLRGGKTIGVPILANSIYPSVEIIQDVLAFGDVTLGVTKTVPLSLRNSGPITGILYLDLSQNTEFAFRLPKDTKNEQENGLKIVQGTFEDGPQDPIDEEKESLVDESSEEHNKPCHKWCISLPPDSTINFDFSFSPTEIGSPEFKLPLKLAGIEHFPALSRQVVACGMRPRLLLSKTNFDFSDTVVRKDSIRRAPNSLRLTLSNDDSQKIIWEIGNPLDDRGSKAFKVMPSKGCLEPDESCYVDIHFVPTEENFYDEKLPVYLDGHKENAYITIQVKGCGILPQLAFSETEVVMPLVPLGIESRSMFTIQNNGYDNLEVGYRLPVDTSRVPLSLSFPDGQNIGIGNPEIRVEIQFKSKKPLCFTANLEFFDAEGNFFRLPVVGTSDNCLFSNFDFVSYHSSHFELFYRKNFPIIYANKQHVKSITKMIESAVKQQQEQSPARDRRGIQAAVEAPTPILVIEPAGVVCEEYSNCNSMSEISTDSLLKWINANCLKTPLVSIPEDLIRALGKPVYEMVELSCSKQIPGKISKLVAIKIDQWKQLKNQYTDMLRFLKSYGAMLHAIHPENLLSQEDYIRCKESEDVDTGLFRKLSAHKLSKRRMKFKNLWVKLSPQSWILVLHQVIKTFFLFRITPKSLDNLPGIDVSMGNALLGVSNKADTQKVSSKAKRVKPLSEDARGLSKSLKSTKTLFDSSTLSACNGSNVYSTAENVLLKWLTYHFNNAISNPSQYRDIYNFSTQLQDCTVFCYVLLSHIPTLAGVGGPLCGFHRNPTTDEHTKVNAASCVRALKHLRIDYGLVSDSIPNMNEREMLLLVMHLYQSLPHYVPRTLIEFSGTLGQVVQKTIELKNPSKKSISYQVELEGSPEFTIQGSLVTLDPLGTSSFLVELRPKFSRSVEARLTFRSEKDGTVAAAPLVFGLKSCIHSRQAIRTKAVESATYELLETEIQIDNKFPVDGNFKISLLQEVIDTNGGKNKSRSAGNVPPKKTLPANFKEFIESNSPFYSKQDKISIASGKSANFNLQFLALKPGSYQCHILLVDENVGEFMYEVIGNAILPVATDSIKFTVEMKSHISKNLEFPRANGLMAKAVASCLDRLSGNLKAKTREIVKRTEDGSKEAYKIELNSPYWVSPVSEMFFGLENASKPRRAKADRVAITTPRGVDNAEGCLALSFHPKAPGIYPCTLLLSSTTDIRVYNIEATVVPPGITTSLEFSAPARQTILQEIPIMNETDHQWMLKSTFTGAKEFTGPLALTVGAHETSSYPLSFYPAWICDVKSQLVLHNTTTDTRFEYNLSGVGEEPLAESQIQLKCVARETVSQEFKVPGIRGQSTTLYTVESDMPHVTGPSTVTAKSNEPVTYKLQFCPTIGGAYSGSITFCAPTGEYFWHTITADVASPEPESTLDIKATVRGAVAVEISLANPLDQIVSFTVDLQGDGLLGSETFSLEALQTATYELIYSPLLPGKQTGAIVFTNELVGEFWYKLRLLADDAQPIILEKMCCAVGDVCSQPILIENPTSETIKLQHSIDNRRNYNIREASTTLGPYASVHVLLDYTPSSLSVAEPAEISFSHPKYGTWRYEVDGIGMIPNRMKETIVHADEGQNGSSLFLFRNPFPKELQVEVSLDESNDEKESVFKILLKKSQAKLAGFAILQVPISFSPQEITEYGANIVVFNSGDLRWTYPIRGVAQAPLCPKVQIIRCKARESLEKSMLFDLRGLVMHHGRDETFSYALNIPPDYERLVERSLQILPITSKLTTAAQPLEYKAKFDPLKPFSCMVEFLVKKASGGVWRFQLSIEATEPDIDDSIVIESSLHQTSSVSFKLCNQFREPANFHCEFTAASSSVFTAFPTTGILSSYGEEGTNFVISFTPVEYGKPLTGRLLITTEEIQWTFDIRGTHPEYVTPAPKSKVYDPVSPKSLKASNSRQTKKRSGR